ncbi:hypothetical protein NPIL_25631, partial [Nephila pilipes]
MPSENFLGNYTQHPVRSRSHRISESAGAG